MQGFVLRDGKRFVGGTDRGRFEPLRPWISPSNLYFLVSACRHTIGARQRVPYTGRKVVFRHPLCLPCVCTDRAFSGWCHQQTQGFIQSTEAGGKSANKRPATLEQSQTTPSTDEMKLRCLFGEKIWGFDSVDNAPSWHMTSRRGVSHLNFV